MWTEIPHPLVSRKSEEAAVEMAVTGWPRGRRAWLLVFFILSASFPAALPRTFGFCKDLCNSELGRGTCQASTDHDAFPNASFRPLNSPTDDQPNPHLRHNRRTARARAWTVGQGKDARRSLPVFPSKSVGMACMVIGSHLAFEWALDRSCSTLRRRSCMSPCTTPPRVVTQCSRSIH